MSDSTSYYSPVKGTFDLYPDDQKYYTFLKKVFRHELRKNGFRRISTPILEDEKLFENISYVHNYKYNLKDSDFIIRPNMHISVMRAFLNGDYDNEIKPLYFYHMGRNFNFYDDGFKEDYCIGGDIIGEDDPILDALLIYINYICIKKICLENKFYIEINSCGIEKEKIKYREELINFYSNKKHLLSEESISNLETNPELLLNTDNEDEQILADQAPKMFKFLKKDSKKHYEKVKEYLDELGVEYIENHKLQAKYNYQTNTIWQFINKDSKDVFIKGCRYNGLSEIIGAEKNIGATGFSMNVVKVIDMLKDNSIKIKNKDELDLYFVQLGDEAKKLVLKLSIEAKEAGINTKVSLGTPSMKEQMLRANRSGAKYVVMVGIMEARSGVFQVRNTEKGTQEEIKKEDIIEYIKDKVGIDKLDFYCPAKDLITSS